MFRWRDDDGEISSAFRLDRALAKKLAVLVVAFVAVPVILFDQFRAKDQSEEALLLQSVEEQGRLIAEALRPVVSRSGELALPALNQALAALVEGGVTDVRVMFRPAKAEGPRSFFYVAASPAVDKTGLEAERKRLIEQGVLDRLADTCDVHIPLGLRYTGPGGREQVVTSITPVHTKSGCWAVVTSNSTADFLGSSIGKPYWRLPEVQIAAAIYIALVLLALSIFIGLWRSLRRFTRHAGNIRRSGRSGTSFAAQSTVPELAGVAEEFDRMVETLQNSAKSIRRAAEDNAHAFKTPIGVIRQSLEPLKSLVRAKPAKPEAVTLWTILDEIWRARGRRALDLIESSLDRLDGLVSYARRMDEVTADFIDPPREPVNLGPLLQGIIEGYREVFASRGLTIAQRIESQAVVRASDELLETVVENILGNAVEFSPEGTEIIVSLVPNGKWVELTVEDSGPGVPDEYLARIFERYFSRRETDPAVTKNIWSHYGIGLWIVRRNVEAVGGRVQAENRDSGGLRLQVVFPLAA